MGAVKTSLKPSEWLPQQLHPAWDALVKDPFGGLSPIPMAPAVVVSVGRTGTALERFLSKFLPDVFGAMREAPMPVALHGSPWGGHWGSVTAITPKTGPAELPEIVRRSVPEWSGASLGFAVSPSVAQKALRQDPLGVVTVLHEIQHALQPIELARVRVFGRPKELMQAIGPPGNVNLAHELAREFSDLSAMFAAYRRDPASGTIHDVLSEVVAEGLARREAVRRGLLSPEAIQGYAQRFGYRLKPVYDPQIREFWDLPPWMQWR